VRFCFGTTSAAEPVVLVPGQDLRGAPGQHPVGLREHGKGLSEVCEVCVVWDIKVGGDDTSPDRARFIATEHVLICHPTDAGVPHKRGTVDQEQLTAFVEEKPPPQTVFEMGWDNYGRLEHNDP
jgi:hypothetical protein